MNDLTDNIRRLTEKAWLILLTEAEILGKTISAIKWCEADDQICTTIAINREMLIINSHFWKNCTVKERVFLLAHEAGHVVQMAFGDDRIKPEYRKEPVRLGKAMDYAINDALSRDANISKYLTPRLLKMGCFPSESSMRPMKSLEYYFEAIGPQDEEDEELQKEYSFLDEDGDEDRDKEGKNYKPSDDLGDDDVENKKDEKQAHQDMLDRILKQNENDSLLKNLTTPLLPKEDQKCITGWKEILRDFLWRKTRTERSYKRPSRRWDGVGPVIPGRSSRDFPRVALILDFSSSMTVYLRACASSIVNLIKQVSGAEVYVVGCGNDIQYEWIIKRNQQAPTEEEILGRFQGGGTNMRPGIEAAKAWGAEVIMCVSDMGVPVENVVSDEVVWITQRNNPAIKRFREQTGYPNKQVFDVLLVD